MKEWYKKWMLKRIIIALRIAVEDHGLKPEVLSFAGNLEATNAMTAGMKKDQTVTITCTRSELSTFISYVIQLHNAKLSLLTRARIGLLALLADEGKMFGDEDPMEFMKREFAGAKTSKDEKRIKLINED